MSQLHVCRRDIEIVVESSESEQRLHASLQREKFYFGHRSGMSQRQQRILRRLGVQLEVHVQSRVLHQQPGGMHAREVILQGGAEAAECHTKHALRQEMLILLHDGQLSESELAGVAHGPSRAVRIRVCRSRSWRRTRRRGIDCEFELESTLPQPRPAQCCIQTQKFHDSHFKEQI